MSGSTDKTRAQADAFGEEALRLDRELGEAIDGISDADWPDDEKTSPGVNVHVVLDTLRRQAVSESQAEAALATASTPPKSALPRTWLDVAGSLLKRAPSWAIGVALVIAVAAYAASKLWPK
jgi:hypothetical protein